jgi:serine/threonine protein phosphatase 1
MAQSRWTYVIADLHGRLDLLEKALGRIAKHARGGPGTLITLGDYIDRGPDSRGVVERLMAGGPDGWHWINLQGNHEQITMIACADPKAIKWWLGNGGGATLVSYGQRQGEAVDTGVVPRSHIEWMQSLPLIYADKRRVYVHAGVERDVSLADHIMLKNDRDAYETLATWKLYDGTDDGWHEENGVKRHVVHGHHQDQSHPLLLPGRTNLDTGAYYTGRLVVGVFDDDEPGGPAEFIEVRGDEW